MEAQAATAPTRGRWEFELYDLSRPLTRETVVALFGDIVADGANPYFTDIAVETPFDFATGTTRASIVRIPDHVGTHVDAPLHMVEGGPSLEQLDLSRLIGEAVVLDLERGDVDHGYTAAELAAAAPGVEPGDIVLIYSGYVDAVEHRRMRQTYLTEEAAVWLVERGVKAVGCEPSGIEHTPQGLFEHGWYRKEAVHPWPAHRALLANDVYIVEGLTNLRPLRGRRVRFAALPVAMPGLTGFSVRAVAWVDR